MWNTSLQTSPSCQDRSKGSSTFFLQQTAVSCYGHSCRLVLVVHAYNADLVLPQPSWVSYAPQGKILSRTVGVTQTTFEDKW